MNDVKPPIETKNKPPIEPTSKPSLPDDLLLSCFARVSRLYYPTLSLVSKSFRSLLASPELYETRSLINRTESCLYVCLESPHDDCIARWFTLSRKPNQTLMTNHVSEKNKKSSEYVLIPISVSDTPPTHRSCLVAIGSKIYNIGGPRDNKPSSSVSILDCRSHTWQHDAPKMKVERNYASASVLDEKIYVSGDDSIEVFDSKTQVWAHVPSPSNSRIYWSGMSNTISIDGNLYLKMLGGQGEMVYNREEDKWDLLKEEMGLDALWLSHCVIDNVLYSYYEESFLTGRKLKWYDIEVRKWKNLMGLEGLPSFPRNARVEVADYGGKMAVLWNEFIPYTACKEDLNTIWCAEIALKMGSDCEIWGEVEWFGDVLEVANLYSLEKVLVPTL